MFPLNLTPCSPSCCPPGMTWDTFLTLRGTKGIYLDHVGTLRPSKSYVWGGGGGVVAHKILVSAQGPLVFGIWVWGLGVWGLGLTTSPKVDPGGKW